MSRGFAGGRLAFPGARHPKNKTTYKMSAKTTKKDEGKVNEEGPVEDMMGPKVQASLNLPQVLVTWLDAVAEAQGHGNRSRAALRIFLEAYAKRDSQTVVRRYHEGKLRQLRAAEDTMGAALEKLAREEGVEQPEFGVDRRKTGYGK